VLTFRTSTAGDAKEETEAADDDDGFSS
jgi:hypothetical protein